MKGLLMRDFEIKRITLDDLDRLNYKGFGNLTNPLRFTELFKDPLQVAKVVYELAIFEGAEKPTLTEFLDSITGNDLEDLRSKFFEAYRYFFPRRVATLLEAWKKERDAIEAETVENALGVGAKEPSN